MAAIELERLGAAFVLALSQSRERLHGGRRQRAQHFGDVRAAAHVTHRVVQALAKAVQQVRTDERAILRSDDVASAGIGHAIGADRKSTRLNSSHMSSRM